jgi:hypothetical protein
MPHSTLRLIYPLYRLLRGSGVLKMGHPVGVATLQSVIRVVTKAMEHLQSASKHRAPPRPALFLTTIAITRASCTFCVTVWYNDCQVTGTRIAPTTVLSLSADTANRNRQKKYVHSNNLTALGNFLHYKILH